MEKKENFNGFKNQEQLDEITEMILNVMWDIPSTNEVVDNFKVLKEDDETISVSFTHNKDSYSIKLLNGGSTEHYVEVETTATKIIYCFVELIAELREKLMNGDFDEYFNND